MDKELRERVILELVKIGISSKKIAGLVGISQTTVEKRLRDFRQSGAIAPKKNRTENVFGEALFEYRGYKKFRSDPPELGPIMLEILGEYIDIPSLYSYIDALSITRKKLLTPVYPANLKPYADFLSAVFRRGWESPDYAEDSFWDNYFKEFFNRKGTLPKSLEALKEDFADWFLESYRAQIVPIWPTYVSFVIDKVLIENFNDRDRYIIQSYFGIGSKKKTFTEIGRDRNTSGQTTNTKLRKLFRQIRMDSGRFQTLHLLWNKCDILGEALADKKPKQMEVIACQLGVLDDKTLDIVIEESPSIDNLLLSIKELGLSTRTNHGLDNWRIQFAWQLVQRTGSELLKIKNFGRKSLVEIEEVLSGLGLRLGMNSSDRIFSLIAEHIDAQKQEEE